MEKHCINCDCYCVCADVETYGKGFDNAEFCDYYKEEDNAINQKGECKSCRHRDPEDKKCDCGELERQGCPFPVSDDYYCKYYEKGGAE